MDRIKKYEPLWGSWYVEKKIGEGSFGAVYKITRTSFNKTFTSAVKLISIPKSEDEINLQRRRNRSEESIKLYYEKQVEHLEQEIILMDELKSAPNVVTIEDFMIKPHADEAGKETIGYDVLIRMEYLENLEDYLAKHEPDEKEVLRMGLDICKALEYCEKVNVIHRDIKPENVFRNKFGDYKVGDFGISRQMDHTTKATSTGTPSYMAPEILVYQPYNQTADIYSLGLMMYQMLNHNRLPFMPDYPGEIWPGDNEIAVKERLSGKEIPIIKGISEDLMRIIIKAASFRKEDRYQHAFEMKEELSKCLADIKSFEEENTKEEDNNTYIPESEETVVLSQMMEKNTQHNPDSEGTVEFNPESEEMEVQTSETDYESENETVILESIQNLPEENESRLGNESDQLSEEKNSNPVFENKEKKISLSETKEDIPSQKKKKGKTTGIVAALAIVLCAGISIALYFNMGKTRTDSEEGRIYISEETDKKMVEEYKEKENATNTTNAANATSDLNNISLGDIISFGSYEQDNDTSNGKEDITWRVLDEKDGSFLLISKYGLDAKPYNEEYKSITWEKCTLRSWLNNDFYDSAFSEEEKSKINISDIKVEYSEAGKDTQDKIFLLGESDFVTYLTVDLFRNCKPTAYAVNNGANYDDSNGYCWWWLRSSGYRGFCTGDVSAIDSPIDDSIAVDCDYGSVRPAMWITP